MINHLSTPLFSCPGRILFALVSILLSNPGIYGGRHGSNPFWRHPASSQFTSVSGSRVTLFRPPQSFVTSEEPPSPGNVTCLLEREWLFGELGVWEPPWSSKIQSKTKSRSPEVPAQFQPQRDQNYNPYSFLDDQEPNNVTSHENPDFDDSDNMAKLESTLSRVKLLPDSRQVSVFLNKGVVKRFLLINDNSGNSVTITIIPCTSILHWIVQFWPVLESSSNLTLEAPHPLKTFRTQRPTTFSEPSASRGVYSVDIRPINYDSYAHIYATLASPDLVSSPPSSLTSSPFVQHVFTHVDLELVQKPKSNPKNPGFDATNTILHSNSSSPKPRLWAQRLSGHRLHLRWDVSPKNPHRAEYCIVVNTRRDYSSLCSASGERFGVLPPDLMHVTYYGSGHRHRHGHGEGQGHSQGQGQPGQGHDLVIGCTGKRTNYILDALEEGVLYYFNVFVRDTSTNVSLPYVATTLKYYTPKTPPNSLRDNKALQLALFVTNGSLISPLTGVQVKFNLNKPCSVVTLYIMPCGGGALNFTLTHGTNRTMYTSTSAQTLDIVTIAHPPKGKYFLSITPELGLGPNNWAKMVEIYVAKKNRRLPLPRLPFITTLTEDIEGRSCDSVRVSWVPSPDSRDNEYCIYLKPAPSRGTRTSWVFKPPNQCDVDRALRSDPYVSHSLCVQKTVERETILHSHPILGLSPGTTYVAQLIVRRHNGKALSYDLTVVKTSKICDKGQS